MAVMLFAQKNFTSLESWEQAEKSKKAVVLLSQPWCGYCKIMENYISKSPEFVELSENYYFLKINATETQPLVFNGKEYVFLKNGLGSGIHSLVTALGGENLVFPTTLILNEEGEILHRFSGFLKSAEIIEILRHLK